MDDGLRTSWTTDSLDCMDDGPDGRMFGAEKNYDKEVREQRPGPTLSATANIDAMTRPIKTE